MFFPELREKERHLSAKVVKGLESRYALWDKSPAYTVCVSLGVSLPTESSAIDSAALDALELCAGAGIMSNKLAVHGFKTVTLDKDPKRSATSKLSLEELETAIVDGHIAHHPHLNKSFSVIWAGPECRTWSRAQCGRYRNMDFIDGRGNAVLDREAQQARRDIEAMVNILSFYKSRNPALIIVIENPVGYLHCHPVSACEYAVIAQ